MLRLRSLLLPLALVMALGAPAVEAGQWKHGGRSSTAKRFRPKRTPGKTAFRATLRSPREVARRQQQVLRTYARTYGQWLHRYNGAFPDEALVLDGRFKDQLEGQMPFWDVDPAQVTADAGDRTRPRVDLVGLTRGSPFVTRDGKLRIYAHYLNRTARKQLEDTFGAPSGHVDAMMTSSFRTLIV